MAASSGRSGKAPGRSAGPLAAAGSVLAGASSEQHEHMISRPQIEVCASATRTELGSSEESKDVVQRDPYDKNPVGTGTIHYTGTIGAPTRLPGSHWTQNPQAMEMMKAMSFSYAIPTLQPRLTKFHGTRVPVLVLFCLLSTEVGRLAILDTFWKRIVQHPMVWQGVYCRDYGTKRCVWRTLEGRAGAAKCLCHLGDTSPNDFTDICKQITSIPGRSKEELLASYRSWRTEQKAILDAQLLKQTNASGVAAVEDAIGAKRSSANPLATGLQHKRTTKATAKFAVQLPWPVRASATFGLKATHVGHAAPSQKAVPVLTEPTCFWSRREPASGPPQLQILSSSPRC